MTTPDRPTAEALLRQLAENFKVTGPDADGLVWLHLHGGGTTGTGAVSLGQSKRLVAQVAIKLEEDRLAALSAPTLVQPVVPTDAQIAEAWDSLHPILPLNNFGRDFARAVLALAAPTMAAVPEAKAEYTIDDFFRDAERTGLKAADFAAALAKRQEFADCLSTPPAQIDTDEATPFLLLEIARATGLRQMLHGVSPADARDALAKFVSAVSEHAVAARIRAAPVAELLAVLCELLEAEGSMMPMGYFGKAAQDAWADRLSKARNDARAAIAKFDRPSKGES